MIERCEGCDQPGTIDWYGNWLCKECAEVEQQEADRAMVIIREQDRKEAESLTWSVSKRGSSEGWLLESVMMNMHVMSKLHADDKKIIRGM